MEKHARRLARFEAASNAENRNYMTAMCMVCSHRDTAAVELVRDGRRMTERIATRSVMNWSPYITERMLDTANIRLLADGIGYMTGVTTPKRTAPGLWKNSGIRRP